MTVFGAPPPGQAQSDLPPPVTTAVALRRRLAALDQAQQLAATWVGHPGAAPVAAATARTRARLVDGADHLLVGLVGPTGVGKSHLFNTLIGEDVSRVSLVRPTTSAATAYVFGGGAERLLDRVGIIDRTSGAAPRGHDGLILIDLPDIDSVNLTHHQLVEDVIEHLDVVMWVVDPQKYADVESRAAYLLPLLRHGTRVVIVVNKSDTLDAPARLRVAQHLHDQLQAAVPERSAASTMSPLFVSAKNGAGIAELRSALTAALADRSIMLGPLVGDVRAAARMLEPPSWASLPQEIEALQHQADGEAYRPIHDHLAAALKVPERAAALAAVHAAQSVEATSWPPLRYQRRLALATALETRQPPGRPMPEVTTGPLQNVGSELLGRLEGSARNGGSATDEGPWSRALRQRLVAAGTAVSTELAGELAVQDEVADRPPVWAGRLGTLQSLLLILAVGALGFATVAVARAPAPPIVPLVWSLPIALVALVVGIAIHVGGARVHDRVAQRHAQEVEDRLRVTIADAADDALAAALVTVDAQTSQIRELLSVATGDHGTGVVTAYFTETDVSEPHDA